VKKLISEVERLTASLEGKKVPRELKGKVEFLIKRLQESIKPRGQWRIKSVGEKKGLLYYYEQLASARQAKGSQEGLENKERYIQERVIS